MIFSRHPNATGPLQGLRVLEVASLGPGPYCCMLLSDLGAEVLRLDRSGYTSPTALNPMHRGRRSVAIDMKRPGAAELTLELVKVADILVEGFRPGVMERLGLGPDRALAINPRLVYGRMTGWGQTGPNRMLPGHDINYIAASGVLAAIGKPGEAPIPPLNLVGDFGGALFLALGVVAAALEAARSGKGQIVDAAMLDSSANMMTMFSGFLRSGHWTENRGENALDGGSPFYGCYKTADNKYVAVGAVEPKFFEEFLRRIGLPLNMAQDQHNRAKWLEMRAAIAAQLARRSWSEWRQIFADAETCFTPVLTLSEAAADPHNRERSVFVDSPEGFQPAPAPRFSRTPGNIQGPPRLPGADTFTALTDWGCTEERVNSMIRDGVLTQVER